MGRLSAVVYTCFSMTQNRISNSVEYFCFFFFLLWSFGFFSWVFCFIFFVGFFFFDMSVSPFSLVPFHFLFFLCLATVRVDMSETPHT